MQQPKLSHHQDIYIDDAITGGDLSRPGFLQFFADAKADPTVSTVFVFKRDRLGRPQDVLPMVTLERDLILSGVTLVTHDRVFTPEDVKANDVAYLIASLIIAELGIAAPDAGRVRRDHGQRHHSPGKWHPTTVRDLCSNPLIAGIKQ